MLRSIRWRLVLSYMLLVLLTLGVVGAIVLQLVEDYVVGQEQEYLTANAEAVALQAGSLMWPMMHHRELQELAQTSAFLGNARVRIVDARYRTLADSESHAEGAGVLWIVPMHEWQVGAAQQVPVPQLMNLPPGAEWPLPLPFDEAFRALEGLPPEMRLVVARTWNDVWGTRFSFQVIDEPTQLAGVQASGVRTPRSERVSTVPIGALDDPLGFVEISQGPDYRTEVVRTIQQAFLFAAGGALLVAVMVGLLVSRRLVAPLRELTGVADRMSGGDLSTRAPVRGRDEIGQLAGQFNRMAERLEASFAELAAERDTLRRFVADASHELRTPITALKSFNELMQGAAADDVAARAEFLAESQAQLDRLEWMTRHLLDLSRLDAGLVALDLAVHSVGDLVESAASAFWPRAREKRIAYAIALPEPSLEIRCDRTRIELALCNLLDNAFKFTPAGGQVELGADRVDANIRLWVRDNGPGIDPEDRPYIFGRFYRGRNQPGEGSGLGLAIVQSVVQAHGGRVCVEGGSGTGSLFVMELPVAP
jgi:signal transduction histidine kinase